MTASNDLNRRIFDLFEAALEQPEDRREQWVREQAVDDMDLLSGVLSKIQRQFSGTAAVTSDRTAAMYGMMEEVV